MATPDWSIIESRGQAGAREAGGRLAATLRCDAAAHELPRLRSMPRPRRPFHDGARSAQVLGADGRTAGQGDLPARARHHWRARKSSRAGRRQRVWGVLWQWHARQANVLCPDDEAQRELVPALVAHLRRKPEGRQLLILGPAPASSTLWDGLRRLGRGGYHVDLRESCAPPGLQHAVRRAAGVARQRSSAAI